MKWYKLKIMKKLFLETTDWNVAWKKNNESSYNVVQNPRGYWLADSLIFSCKKGIFLFVEAYDKKEKIGKLAVLKYNGEIFSDFRIIMEKSYHLSYPYVFEYNNEYFMIPETSQNNCIEIYKSVNFPYEWVKIKELMEGEYVDTTVFRYNDEIILYSYDMSNHKLLTGILDMNSLEINNVSFKIDSEYKLRAGGNVFEQNDLYCRAVQDNKYFYGQKLNIINCFNNNVIDELKPIDILNDKNITFKRLHTYSKSGEYEAIDLSSYKFNLFKIIKKMKGVIKK